MFSGALTQRSAWLVSPLRNLQRARKVSVARICTTCRFFGAESDTDAPYWCNLLEAPLLPATLRLDCPEHQATA